MVGYLRAPIAAVLHDACRDAGVAPPPFAVAGVLRGGADRGHEEVYLGVHAWLEQRLSPGPQVEFGDGAYLVSWPPYDDEIEDCRDC
jgi:hypothetical protein